jgi:hypothetical protein
VDRHLKDLVLSEELQRTRTCGRGCEQPSGLCTRSGCSFVIHRLGQVFHPIIAWKAFYRPSYPQQVHILGITKRNAGSRSMSGAAGRGTEYARSSRPATFGCEGGSSGIAPYPSGLVSGPPTVTKCCTCGFAPETTIRARSAQARIVKTGAHRHAPACCGHHVSTAAGPRPTPHNDMHLRRHGSRGHTLLEIQRASYPQSFHEMGILSVTGATC